MKQSDILKVEAAIGPFRFGAVQDAVTLARHLRRRGVSFSLLEQYIAARVRGIRRDTRRLEARQATLARIWPHCPDCGEFVKIAPGDDGDSHWFCPKCRWGRYDARTKDQVIRELTAQAEAELRDGGK